jgi:hypothetical protein
MQTYFCLYKNNYLLFLKIKKITLYFKKLKKLQNNQFFYKHKQNYS